MKSQMLQVVGKGKVEMRNVELPELGEKDVLVKVSKSLVSPGTERAFILGLENTTANYPFKSGYAACSVVQEVGPGVTALKKGDRVTGFGIAHQRFGVEKENRLVKVRDSVSDEEGAFGALGLICMQGVRKARLELGESCMIIGLGPIGQIAMQIAKSTGAYPVIAVDKSSERLELAKQCGADVCINSDDADWLEQLNCSCGSGCDVVIECTGFPAAISNSLDAAARYGRVIILGSTRGDCNINVYKYIHKKGLTIIGAHSECVPQIDSWPGHWTHFKDLSCFIDLMATKKVNVKPLITERYSCKDILSLYYNKILTWNTKVVGAIVDWSE